jgi:hypothetical protein
MRVRDYLWAGALLAVLAWAVLGTVQAQEELADAEVVRFLNEEVRPWAERLRALKAEAHSTTVRWQSISGSIMQDTRVIEDGRSAEGISRLTGNDVHDLMFVVSTLNSTLTGVADATIEKPTVRPLRVRGSE